MNNKKILGIPITLFVIGLIAIAGASAALVTYLSNTTEATYSVESPFELKNAIGHIMPTDPTDIDSDSLGFTSGSTIVFENIDGETTLTGTDEIRWTNYIGSRASADIWVYDFEVISGEDSESVLTMDELNVQYDFFGARYWRPQGSDSRLVNYAGDIELGWDPYTLDTSGVITCHGNALSGVSGADLSGTAYVAIKDGICYYVDDAFNFNVVGDDLISDYGYNYVAGTEEIAQYTAVLTAATTPGTYDYMRQINIQQI